MIRLLCDWCGEEISTRYERRPDVDSDSRELSSPARVERIRMDMKFVIDGKEHEQIHLHRECVTKIIIALGEEATKWERRLAEGTNENNLGGGGR